MAKDDRRKNSKDKKSEKSPPKDVDLDKTVTDIDIRKLEKDEEMEETVIVRVPQEEDSDFHKDFLEEEITGDHEVEALQKKEAEKRPPEPVPPPEVKKEEEKKPEKKKPKEAKKEKEEPSLLLALKRPKFSLVYFLMSVVLFLLLVGGLLEALRSGGALRLPALILTAFSGLCLAGNLLKRLDSQKVFLWVSVAWFAYVSYAGYYFYTSYLTYFLNFKLSSLMGPFLVLAGAIVTLILLGTKKFSFLWKIPALVGWFLISVAFFFNLIRGESFEGGLWGPAIFANSPLWIRPGVLALGLAFPLMGLSVILKVLFSKEPGGGLIRGKGLGLLLLCILGSLLGSKLLSRQGMTVPLLGELTSDNYYGSTFLDPQQSSIRLTVSNQKGKVVKEWVSRLEVAASLSKPKGKGQESYLMVRNMEGRPYADSKLGQSIKLWRGEHRLKGGKARLVSTRIGQPRHLAILVNLPSLEKSQVKTSLVSALFHLARQMDQSDRLYLLSGAGGYVLSKSQEENWKKGLDKVLAPKSAALGELYSAALKKLSGLKGLRQIILIGNANNLPDVAGQKELQAQSQKTKIPISFLGLGPGFSNSTQIYRAEFPAALGMELLSAAALSFGDYTLQFPKLPPLPQIILSRNSEGKVVVQGGKILFEIKTDNPQEIAALTFRVDNEKPIDLDPKTLRQILDLSKWKLKPGLHQFGIQLVTQAEDVVFEYFEAHYVTQKPLQFVKPLDKDSISKVLNVMFAPGRIQGLTTRSIELFSDGEQIGIATAEPYLVSLNTTDMATGEHTLQAIQTFSDGNTETVQIKVQVNPQLPQFEIVRPTNGEFLSNLAEIEAEVGGGLFQQVEKVEYLVDGEWVGESLSAPFRYLWSNPNFPAGKYFIQARAHLNNQAMVTDAVRVQLAQAEVVVQADPQQSPAGSLFPENVEVLMDASVTMNESLGKALKIDLAKYALSELVLALPQNVNLMTRVYGAKSHVAERNCEDSYRLKNAGKQLGTLSAKGTSPLAYALGQMGRDLSKVKGSRIGLLITDGWDLCGEDPLVVAQKFAKKKDRLRLHVIYFNDTDPTSESLLKRLAEVTGGRVYKVSRQEGLIEATRDAIQVNFSLYDFKNTAVVEQPLSKHPFYVRSGEYRLEIDTVPPIRREGLSLVTGVQKSFTVTRGDEGYQLNEE